MAKARRPRKPRGRAAKQSPAPAKKSAPSLRKKWGRVKEYRVESEAPAEPNPEAARAILGWLARRAGKPDKR